MSYIQVTVALPPSVYERFLQSPHSITDIIVWGLEVAEEEHDDL